MKAISVFPGKANSVHLADLNKPSIDEVPDGRGVLVSGLVIYCYCCQPPPRAW